MGAKIRWGPKNRRQGHGGRWQNEATEMTSIGIKSVIVGEGSRALRTVIETLD